MGRVSDAGLTFTHKLWLAFRVKLLSTASISSLKATSSKMNSPERYLAIGNKVRFLCTAKVITNLSPDLLAFFAQDWTHSVMKLI